MLEIPKAQHKIGHCRYNTLLLTMSAKSASFVTLITNQYPMHLWQVFDENTLSLLFSEASHAGELYYRS